MRLQMMLEQLSQPQSVAAQLLAPATEDDQQDDNESPAAAPAPSDRPAEPASRVERNVVAKLYAEF
jgi:hypothetical protein